MRFDYGGSELNGRDPRGISIANGLNSPASRVVRGLVGWVLFSPRDCGISLGTYLCYFHFFHRLRSQILHDKSSWLAKRHGRNGYCCFRLLAGSADTLV